MRTLIIMFALLLLSACSDDGAPPAPEKMRVVKVSGDQTTRVPPAPVVSSAVVASVMASDGWTDEPLVARVEASGGAGIMGTSSTIPPGTLVHWHLEEGAGKLYGGETATDDSAHVVNRFAPGTVAGTYKATAGRLVDGEIVTDATWTLIVEPGPPTVLQTNCGGFCGPFAPGDTVDIRDFLEWGLDDYGNHIDTEALGAWPASEVEWAWAANGQPPSQPKGSGWVVIVPESENDNLILWFSGEWVASLPFTVEP